LEDLAAYLEARPDAKDAQVITLALEEAREQANLVLH
jgi:regulator of sirC expression with transglutaminase-like and TPR domain